MPIWQSNGRSSRELVRSTAGRDAIGPATACFATSKVCEYMFGLCRIAEVAVRADQHRDAAYPAIRHSRAHAACGMTTVHRVEAVRLDRDLVERCDFVSAA